ncbi:MAG: hypothetical protein ACLT76_00495 [Clostridium fessum]
MIPFQAFASKDTEDRSPVGSIGLNVSSSIHVGDESSDVDVSLDFGDCDISNVDVINEPSGKWVDKDKPKLEVTLRRTMIIILNPVMRKRMWPER